MSSPASIAHGPALAGTFCNVTLFGILLSQSFFYFTTFTKDKLGIKLFVAALLLADTVNCAFDMWWIYDILVNRFGDFGALQRGNWVFASDPAMVAIVIVWLITAAVCDTAITISLSLYLRRHKTGFATTDRLVDRIIRTTVQNGLITAVWAITDLVVYLSTPTGLHLAFNFPLGKLYSCTLMSTLNSRAGGGYERPRMFPNTTDSPEKAHALTCGRPRITSPEVFVDVERHKVSDMVGSEQASQC
ncbi:hypothetical protein PUNSTDRAFT_133149 [Punctularia strigosozonata HHB-11173 SS5]|uniref:uncharacterized protein n=1 Tax=Punctularia strigosozonata (strain HHB-11173) TaxID=741275 RepID=UPI000441639A|nr:uncharacterized protein PUNSTDRAFT_133149 [Punctularia strigosozonata HHB-11173 SS5]EIN11098.1 hypothetical protein PUNSTDRAFT_133149 [Punctularia strigosozonata HHB-11173 SS5]